MFIVGELPDWVQNVEHIDVQDVYANVRGGKFKNVVRKMRGACLDQRVSESYVLMNDDFFFLKDSEEIFPYTVGSLEKMIELHSARYGDDGRNQYTNILIRTLDFLRKKKGISEPVSYAIHYPIVYNKAKLLELTDEIDWLEKPVSWRIIYGNVLNIGNIEREDPKVSSEDALERFLAKDDKGDFLSISDNVALNKKFQNWIEERFPEKSKYEI